MELTLDSITPIIYEGKIKFNISFKTRLSKDELKSFLDKSISGRIKIALDKTDSFDDSLLIFNVFNNDNRN